MSKQVLITVRRNIFHIFRKLSKLVLNVYTYHLFIIFFLTFLKVKVRFLCLKKNIVAFVEKSPLLNILWPAISKFISQQGSIDVDSVENTK
jgi:hypothetical protein